MTLSCVCLANVDEYQTEKRLVTTQLHDPVYRCKTHLHVPFLFIRKCCRILYCMLFMYGENIIFCFIETDYGRMHMNLSSSCSYLTQYVNNWLKKISKREFEINFLHQYQTFSFIVTSRKYSGHRSLILNLRCSKISAVTRGTVCINFNESTRYS
jgi:hypothetical protein